MYDAVVVGAGPVGSYVARGLAKQGHRVIVLERRPAVGDAVCCTGIVSKECFDRFPLPSGSVVAEASSCKLFSPSGKMLRLQKEGVQAYIVDRHAFDNDLAEMARDEGVEYLLSAKVDGLSLVDHRVRADVFWDGGVREVEGKVVILCNGFGSSLPRKLGLGQVGDFVLGAQAEVSVAGVDEAEVYFGQDIAAGFFAWLVPIEPGRALAGLLSRRSPGPRMKEFLSRLRDEGKVTSDEWEIRYGGIPLKPLPRTYGDRIVVVGDAAGQVKPTTGGGIYYGLLSADIAATTIHEAICAGDVTAGGLRGYEKGWKAVLARDLRIGYWSRRLYERLSDNRIDHLFDVMESNNIHEALLQSPDFSFDWHGDSILGALRQRPLRQALWATAKSMLPF